MQNQTRAATLHKGEFQRLIKITWATSKLPERDVLVLMLGHKAGMRVTEISRALARDRLFLDDALDKRARERHFECARNLASRIIAGNYA